MKKIKVIIIGDSISKGVVYANEKLSVAEHSAVDIIGQALDYEIINISSYGQTLKRIFQKNMLTNILSNKDKTKKNYAVLSIGGNDADYDWKKVSANPEFEHLPKTPLNEFVDYYQQIIKTLQKNGFIVIVCSISPIKAEWYFKNVISKIADPDNVLKFLHDDLSNLTRHQELFNNEIIKIAVRQKLKFIDIRKIFLQDNACFEYFCEDGAHLTEDGQNMIAKKVIQILEN